LSPPEGPAGAFEEVRDGADSDADAGTDSDAARAGQPLAEDRVAGRMRLVWRVDAILKWLPGFRTGYMATIMGEADGQPGWLKPWFRFWIDWQHPHPYAFASLVAVAETLIAVAIIVGFARKLTYTAAIVFSLLIWATAEGFGGPYPPARPISVLRSSTHSCSPRCSPSPTTRERRDSPSTKTLTSASPGGIGSPRSAAATTPALSCRHKSAARLSRRSPWPGTGSRKKRRAVSQ
jgi:hypothetical protein